MTGGLAKILGIRPGSKVSVIDPPSGFVSLLNPLPDGVEFLVTARTGLDVILFFTRTPRELVERLPALSRAMALTGKIWICWPVGERGCKLTEDLIRQAALELGMVDDKRWLLDETWAGLRLVWKPRPKLERPEGRSVQPGAQA